MTITEYFQDRYIACICCLILILTSTLNLILSDPVSILALVPVNTLIANSYVWNVFTCAFYEKMLLKIILDVLLSLVSIKSLKVESFEQFGLYFLSSILFTSFCTSAVYFISFFSTLLEDQLIKPTYGFSGIYIILLMYCRRQYGHEPVHSSFPLITHHNLPVLYLTIQAILLIFTVPVLPNDILFSIISLLYSWTYLRFFYRFNDDLPVGDTSEEFAFVEMFPEALKPVTIPLTTAFYNVGVLVGLFPPLAEMNDKRQQHHLRYQNPSSMTVASNAVSNTPATTVLTSVSIQDALQERRRAKAMKLLDAKLAELSKESGDGWDVKEREDTVDDNTV